MEKYLAGVVLTFFLTNWMTYANGCESNSGCGIGLYCCRQIKSCRPSCDDTACSSDMDCGPPFSSCSSEKICTHVTHSRRRRSNSKSDSDGLSIGITGVIVVIVVIAVAVAFVIMYVCFWKIACNTSTSGGGIGGSYWMRRTGGGYGGGGGGDGGGC